ASVKAAADTLVKVESRLAGASLDNVTLRDPAATDHKTTFGDLQKLAPAVDWKGYFENAKLPVADLNVEEPKFLQEVDRQVRETPLADWKIYLKWQLLHASAFALSAPFVEENFNFYQHYLGGAKEFRRGGKGCEKRRAWLLAKARAKNKWKNTSLLAPRRGYRRW